ncbi:MAG: hypothetical protein UX88_C0035G0004 [Candidatus Woesebacteria bacterium GW2011_GWC2_47_16]|uniref:Uncharacterized protein n=9 Tax=Candidatus Woeseibacteriota TaxID=1752722 RepID=A0A0G1VLC1_9BACT|nr:MAG: hypothetical protein UX03_C0025G0007 [Candidatus Woesebacteria bacterium GW2011_GWE1_45_18]KKU23486.1 MAG: hypothetical protein UX34_C0011G0013 [Candidatus Woesebacteria bacterium GW2011_GWF1_46_13]KKU63226.1 MAG: hypothetical protein UX88_C0035G0004 [Candidatus Woesebacteria bacterium GW2011_GWC2_47_16]KKU70845.1 MAG: hypothetical protein UX95_C0012G0004 [Candidatus Woesebacteria bacterium GW2011_GWD1_47_21]OGM77167.1 MAG: hypothetical protein A2197_01210 [Candidatus Woesebacteria bact
MGDPERRTNPFVRNREILVQVIHQIGNEGFTAEELIDSWSKLPDVGIPLIDGGQSVPEYLDELTLLRVLRRERGKFFLADYYPKEVYRDVSREVEFTLSTTSGVPVDKMYRIMYHGS